MGCPTCGHTLAKLADKGGGIFRCERCGTVVVRRAGDWEDVYVPMLVQRCRRFHSLAVTQLREVERLGGYHNYWVNLGIAEAIGPPPEGG